VKLCQELASSRVLLTMNTLANHPGLNQSRLRTESAEPEGRSRQGTEALEAFRDLGFTLELQPPLAIEHPPLPVALRTLEDGSFLALTALEIDRFEIRSEALEALLDAPEIRRNSALSRVERAWSLAAAALSHLPEPRELWYAVARSTTGDVGARVRTGWVVVGRGEDRRCALDDAALGLGHVLAIQCGFLDFLTARPVGSATALLDLVRPSASPFLKAMRRAPWMPPSETPREGRMSVSGTCVLPWVPSDRRWAPLADLVTVPGGPNGFIVRIVAGQPTAPDVIAMAARDAHTIGSARDSLQRTSVADGVLLRKQTRALEIAEARLNTLRQPSLAVDATLCSEMPIGAGALGVALSCLADPSASAPRIDTVDLPRGSFLAPLDLAANPELITGPDDAWALARTMEPPIDERSPLPCSRALSHPMRGGGVSGTRLGTAQRAGREQRVHLAEAARFQHAYVVGQTGTGKSTLLLNMIADDIRAGHGVTVLDPHGSLIRDILDRIPPERSGDVVVIDPASTDRSVPLNPLAISAASPAEYTAMRDRIIDEIIDTFDALYDLKETGGPIFEQNFRVFMALVMGGRKPEDYTPILPMIETAMNDRALQKRLAARMRIDDPVTPATLANLIEAGGDLSSKNVIPYITSKLTRFYAPAVSRRILCQPDCIDFDDVLRERRIVLVDLDSARIGTESAALLARQIVLRLSIAAMARGTAPESPAHFIYADEFHTFATERFARLLAEARKFRLGLVLAHQYTSQLARRNDNRILNAVLGNVGTVIAFRVGAADAALLGNVMAPQIRPEELTGLPDHHAFVRSVGGLANVPFLLRTSPPDAHLEADGARIRRIASRTYARDREDVDWGIFRALAEFGNAALLRAAG
jgi:hypothetical protein